MRERDADDFLRSTWQHVSDLPGTPEGACVPVRAALGTHARYLRVAVPCRDRTTGQERAWPGAFTATTRWLQEWEDAHDVDPPPAGDLTPTLVDTLVEALSAGRPDRPCLFATWSGYADLHRAREAVLELPPGREMVAVVARLDEVHDVAGQLGRYPLRWFSADATWAVGADLYARSIVVAGDDRTTRLQAGPHALSASPLRAVPVDGSAPLPTFPA